MSTKVRSIGVVGLGRGRQLAMICQNLPNARLAAVADLLPERRERAAQEFGPEVNRYEHYKTMLEREKLDVLVVATLGLHHRDATVDGAAAGVREIYVEKPMATSLADCDAMMAACEAHGTILTMGHQRRWWPEYHAARDALRAGAIGTPTNGYVYWGSGRVGSVGTHLLDALNLVVDSDVEWVSGRVDPTTKPQPQWPDIIDPGALGFISYRNGLRIALDTMDDVYQTSDMLFFGTRGRLFVQEDAFNVKYWALDPDVQAKTRGYGIPFPEKQYNQPAPPIDPNNHGAIEGLTELLDCIETGRQPSSTGRDGRRALEVIVGLHVSSRNDMKRVAFPLTGADVELDLKFR